MNLDDICRLVVWINDKLGLDIVSFIVLLKEKHVVLHYFSLGRLKYIFQALFIIR